MRKKTIKSYISVLILLSLQSIAFAQESDALLHEKTPKNQIGIGINRFINSLFPSDNNTFLVEYRYAKSSDFHYRAGANYNFDSSEDGLLSLGLKVGVDKTFLQQGNWYFYYGIDVGGNYNYYKKSQKNIGNVFISPFLGVMYKFNKSFSVSTEPNVYYMTHFVIDNGTFEADNKKVWGQSGFGKIGYLQLNFHF